MCHPWKRAGRRPAPQQKYLSSGGAVFSKLIPSSAFLPRQSVAGRGWQRRGAGGGGGSQENMRRWPNVGLLLKQRRRQWANSKPMLGQRLMFAGRGEIRKWQTISQAWWNWLISRNKHKVDDNVEDEPLSPQTRGTVPNWVHCWAIVADCWPTLNRHWVSVFVWAWSPSRTASEPHDLTLQIWAVHLVLVYCWATVENGGLTVKHHR